MQPLMSQPTNMQALQSLKAFAPAANSRRPRCLLVQRRCPHAAATRATSFPDGAGVGPAAATVSPQQAPLPNVGKEDPSGEALQPLVAPTEPLEQPPTFLGRVKRFFAGPKIDKARLAALGFGAFSAYGVISNINAGILITIAWLTVVRTTGLTPLDGGNWPRFAAIYAGLWIGSNFLRPLRLTLALAVAPLFDAAIGAVSRRTRLPRVPAFVLMLLCIAVGTTSLLGATLAVLGGFPPGCRMPWQPLAG